MSDQYNRRELLKITGGVALTGAALALVPQSAAHSIVVPNEGERSRAVPGIVTHSIGSRVVSVSTADMRRPFTNVPTRYFDDDWVFRPGDEVVVILSDDGHFVGPLVWPVSGRVTVSDDFVQVGKSQARIRNQSAKRSATDAASSFSEAIFVKNQDGEFSLFGVS